MIGHQGSNFNNMKGHFKLFIGPMFAKKCLAKNTPILMYNGTIRKVQDIRKDDLIMGDDSTPRRVLSLARGFDDMYKVTPMSGEPYFVNSAHILCVKFAGCNFVQYNADDCSWDVHWFESDDKVTTQFYICDYGDSMLARDAAQKFREGLETNPKYTRPHTTMDITVSQFKNKTPMWRQFWLGYRNPVQYPTKSVPVDPYIVGLLLGPVPLNAIAEPVISNYLKNDALACHWFSFALRNNYDTYKHIPDDYKYNSRENRLKLLAGLIDNFGVYEEETNLFTLRLDHIRLADDVDYLVKSLGFACNKIFGSNWVIINITGLGLDLIPTQIKGKQALPLLECNTCSCYGCVSPCDHLLRQCDHSRYLLTKIEVTPTNPNNYYGFELDGNGRFLLGDFTVTHNTSSMCDEVERYHIANRLCVNIKYANDTRYDNNITRGGIMPHSGHERYGIPVIKTINLSDVLDEISEYDVIGIDEVQFYPDNVECIQKLANMGKIVIAAGLDGNYLGKPFGRIAELISIAEDVHKLKAICMCCNDEASFTKRLGSNTEEVDIGGTDKYVAVCRRCMWENPDDSP